MRLGSVRVGAVLLGYVHVRSVPVGSVQVGSVQGLLTYTMLLNTEQAPCAHDKHPSSNFPLASYLQHFLALLMNPLK